MHIPLEIHPPSGEPYVIDYVFPTARMKAAITVGMEIPVKVLPDQPERDRRAVGRAAGVDRGGRRRHGRRDIGGLQATYGNAADDAMRQAQANAAAEDPRRSSRSSARCATRA